MTPIKDQRVARGVYHWKFEKPGYATAETLTADLPPGSRGTCGEPAEVELDARGRRPADMVRVPPMAPGLFWGRRVFQAGDRSSRRSGWTASK